MQYLNITPKAQNEFIGYLEEKYAQQLEAGFIAEVQRGFILNALFPYHAVRFAGEVDLEGLLYSLTDVAVQAIKAPLAPIPEALNSLREQSSTLGVLKYLGELSSDSRQALIVAEDYAVFRWATEKGHLDVLKYLIELSSIRVQARIAADNYVLFRCVAPPNHLINVVTSLLSFTRVFAYVEARKREYGEVVRPYIDEMLQRLHDQVLTLESQNDFIVFDVNPKEAFRYFYVVRNLIRRNEAALLDELRFLISIPAIKALLHAEITPGRPNELLHLALNIRNAPAAQLLLSVPAVHELATVHQFYKAEQCGHSNQRELAADYKSSMHAARCAEEVDLKSLLHVPLAVVPIEIKVKIDQVFTTIHSIREVSSTDELTLLLDSLEEHSRAYLISADREQYQKACAHAFACYEHASNTLPHSIHSTVYSLVQCIYRVVHDLLQLIGALFSRQSTPASITHVGLFAPRYASSSLRESINALKQCIKSLPDVSPSEAANPI